jgi:hypothetical protein
MHEINELWSSPWRDLQQNLAIEREVEGSTRHQERQPPSKSWLGRAQNRRPQGSRRAQ